MVEQQREYRTPVAFPQDFMMKTGAWRYQRPVTDATRCYKCGVCWLYCPTHARYEAETHFDTNLEYCKGCGICASECWAQAITMVPEDPE